MNSLSLREQLLSAFGGAAGILATAALALWLFPAIDPALPWLIASMGSSAVLLFAVPHGPLSQPWPLLGGHLVSALIGVACARWLGTDLWSAGAAAGLSIGAMHPLRCIHPPGGATALTAVIGGPSITALGFGFVLMPVLVNALTLLLLAVLWNAPWHWRRYPASWARRSRQPDPASRTAPLEHRHLAAALRTLDSFIDVTEQDLQRIYALAAEEAQHTQAATPPIRTGQAYSNGSFGQDWEVRQVLSIDDGDGPSSDQTRRVRFRSLAGAGRRCEGECTLEEFRHWAVSAVERDENSWRPVANVNHDDSAS